MALEEDLPNRSNRTGARAIQHADRMSLYEAVERQFNTPMLVLSLLLIPCILLPLVWHEMPATLTEILIVLDWVIWFAFVVEYLTLFALVAAPAAEVPNHY